MARKALIEKAKKTPKFSVRKYTRCFNCGRSQAFRKYGLCMRSFRLSVYRGEVPGFRKIS
jgi:small subunit ribosomal protein S14